MQIPTNFCHHISIITINYRRSITGERSDIHNRIAYVISITTIHIYKPIVPWWHVVKCANIGSCNCLSLVRHQTITWTHYDDVIMTMLASQITSLTVVYSIVYSGVNQRKHQSSASLAFVREIHRGPVNFPHKWPVTRKMFPFDDVIMPCWLIVNQTLRNKHRQNLNQKSVEENLYFGS